MKKIAIPRPSLVKLQPVTPNSPVVGSTETMAFALDRPYSQGTNFRVRIVHGSGDEKTPEYTHSHDLVLFDVPVGAREGASEAILELADQEEDKLDECWTELLRRTFQKG